MLSFATAKADRFGHLAGDDALRTSARIAGESLGRSVDELESRPPKLLVRRLPACPI
ncbi:MAG: hypothetical protein NVSMB64_07710 [Candidatus Velthaea sp.]